MKQNIFSKEGITVIFAILLFFASFWAGYLKDRKKSDIRIAKITQMTDISDEYSKIYQNEIFKIKPADIRKYNCLSNAPDDKAKKACYTKLKKDREQEISERLKKLEQVVTGEQYKQITDSQEIWNRLKENDFKIIDKQKPTEICKETYCEVEENKDYIVRERSDYLNYLFVSHTLEGLKDEK